MKKIVIGIGVIGVVAIAWWLLSPLWFDARVNESASTDIESALSELREQQTGGGQVIENQNKAEETKKNAEVIGMIDLLSEQVEDEEMRGDFQNDMLVLGMDDSMMDEESPMMKEEVTSTVVASGTFTDVAHEGVGNAYIIATKDGTVLRFENFDVLNGPDLRVVLSPANVVSGAGDLGDYVELGKLKGNVGDQNYTIDSSIDISKYHSVVIYCKAFHVVFNSASLR